MTPGLDNPLALATGCFLWVPLMIWIVGLVGWMISGDVDFLPGIAGIGVAIAMGYLGLNPPSPVLPPLLLVGSLTTLVVMPFARLAMNKAALKSIEIESMERAYQLLGEKPDNLGAKLRLAKALYAQGYVGQAVAIADSALKGANESLFRDELSMLRQWRANQLNPNVHGKAISVRCADCGRVNEPDKWFCFNCGARFLLDYVRGKSTNSAVKAKVLAAWTVAMLAMIGIPLAATTLPLAVAIVAIIALCGLAGAILLFVWKRSVGDT